MALYKFSETTTGLTRKRNPLIDNLSIQYISFDKLLVTDSQKSCFDIDHLREIVENFHPALLKSPSVALVNGDFILWEGQHSAFAAWLNGMDKIPCLVFETTDLSFKDIPSIEKFDHNQFGHLLDMFMEDTQIDTIEQLKQSLRPFDTSI
jgi:hypothetical protein